MYLVNERRQYKTMFSKTYFCLARDNLILSSCKFGYDIRKQIFLTLGEMILETSLSNGDSY